MRIALLLALSLTLVLPAVAQESPELSPQLNAALEDLRQRDANKAQKLRRALRSNPREARARLEKHARYLKQLDESQTKNPEMHRLLLEQEGMEKEARALLVRFKTQPKQRVTVEHELRALLNVWFDVRQSCRTVQADKMSRELAAQRTRLSKEPSEGEAIKWLGRVTKGGAPAMRRRIVKLGSTDEMEVLAPKFVQAAMRSEPEFGQRLAQLSESSPFKFRAALSDAVRDHPEWLEEARRECAAEIELHSTLRAAIRALHEVLVPVVEAQVSNLTPDRLAPDARSKLDAVLGARRGVISRQLEEAERNVAEQRAKLARRLEKKMLLVDLQFARITGDDVYDW